MTHSAIQYPCQNPDLPVEQRIDDLLGRMTLDEKIACLSTEPGVPRLGVKGSGHVEGLHGLAMGGPANWSPPVPIPTTTFPQAIGLGETWDPDLVQQAGTVEGREARYIFQSPRYRQGGLVVRAPNADLGRDPRWGRTEECFGEDPYFNGIMSVAMIRGLQGDHPRYWLTASLLKHFLSNSNENGRESSSSDYDQRLFHEYYAVPFRMGIVHGGANAFMAAYNAVNGMPCTVHPVLRNVTMRQWGLDGIICTDGGALKLLISDHEYYPDLAHGAAWAIKSGITQFLDEFHEAVAEAIRRDYLAEPDLDEAIRRNFRIMIKLGLLDPPELCPYASIGAGGEVEPWLSEGHRAIARLVTRKSIVLLKNAGPLLPLDRRAIRSIAVIGPRADDHLLDWYSGKPPYTITALQGIRAKAGEGIIVRHASTNDRNEAVAAAEASDVAIVCVGNHPTCNAGWARTLLPSDGKEAVDRQSITLEQEELVRQVCAANPRTVMVLISSFPYAINWSQQNVPAIVHLTHCSQELGSALADVLFGDFNPAGRLVQTWPKSLDDLPPMMDYDLRHGRTYLYSERVPLYPFGHGLSYTTFDYARLRTSGKTLAEDSAIQASVDVANTGSRAGEEVVQLYVRYLDSAVARPRMQLAGFRRVAIEPGQTKTIEIGLRTSQLAYWDLTRRQFALEPCDIELLVGASSADIRLRKAVHVGRRR